MVAQRPGVTPDIGDWRRPSDLPLFPGARAPQPGPSRPPARGRRPGGAADEAAAPPPAGGRRRPAPPAGGPRAGPRRPAPRAQRPRRLRQDHPPEPVARRPPRRPPGGLGDAGRARRRARLRGPPGGRAAPAGPGRRPGHPGPAAPARARCAPPTWGPPWPRSCWRPRRRTGPSWSWTTSRRWPIRGCTRSWTPCCATRRRACAWWRRRGSTRPCPWPGGGRGVTWWSCARRPALHRRRGRALPRPRAPRPSVAGRRGRC